MSESQEELMERLNKMSPEERDQYYKERCIFCQIISGKIPSKKVYEDQKVVAILDINPAGEGHLLVMPKEHYSIMPQVPEDIQRHLGIVMKNLSQAALKSLGSKGSTLLIQNGMAAGQKAQHFMIHLIPRRENDGVGLIPERKRISENDYSVILERVRKKIGELLGTSFKPHAVDVPYEEMPPEMPEQYSPETPPEELQSEQPLPEEPSSNEPENPSFSPVAKFITSESAKRYHTERCPFAQNIPETKRRYLTPVEAGSSGKKACTCVSGQRIPLDEVNTELDNLNEDINNTGVKLNDIARLFQ